MRPVLLVHSSCTIFYDSRHNLSSWGVGLVRLTALYLAYVLAAFLSSEGLNPRHKVRFGEFLKCLLRVLYTSSHAKRQWRVSVDLRPMYVRWITILATQKKIPVDYNVKHATIHRESYMKWEVSVFDSGCTRQPSCAATHWGRDVWRWKKRIAINGTSAQGTW